MIETKCYCGEYKKCIRKINTSSNGKMWIENKSHFSCGKIKNQIKKLNKWFEQFKKKQNATRQFS
jgi:hypothetical protein